MEPKKIRPHLCVASVPASLWWATWLVPGSTDTCRNRCSRRLWVYKGQGQMGRLMQRCLVPRRGPAGRPGALWEPGIRREERGCCGPAGGGSSAPLSFLSPDLTGLRLSGTPGAWRRWCPGGIKGQRCKGLTPALSPQKPRKIKICSLGPKSPCCPLTTSKDTAMGGT